MSNERERERGVAGQGEMNKETVTATSRKVTVTDDRIDSRALFGAARQIAIEHGADTYILRLTAQNKLILTK
jgi:hemin uptake protein HemP